MTSISLPKKFVHACSLAMARDDARYYLLGLSLESNGRDVILVGADGHRLHICRWVKEQGEPCTPFSAIIPAPLVNAIVKAKAPRVGAVEPPALLTVGYADANGVRDLTVKLPDGTSIGGRSINGRFPDWRRHIPTGAASGVAAIVNPQYLLDLCDGARIALGRPKKQLVCAVQHNGPGECVRLVVDEFLGIVMPMRVEAEQCIPVSFTAPMLPVAEA